jgi:hypothetical protein
MQAGFRRVDGSLRRGAGPEAGERWRGTASSISLHSSSSEMSE